MSVQAQQYWEIPYGSFLGDNKPLGDEFAKLKEDIIATHGKDNIKRSWLQVTKLLKEENQTIAEKGSSIWPEIDFEELSNPAESKVEEIKQRGLVVVRNIFSEDQAAKWLSSLDTYLKDNSEEIASFPPENPWLFVAYFSPVQNEIRSHERSLKAQEFINKLWTGYSPENSSPFPLSYADSLRFRQPGGFSATVRPHIDAGSLDRWADETYRHYYDQIFSGDVLSHDPYDLTHRIGADSNKFPGIGQTTVFRAFQGWTSLSKSGGGFGKASLAVFPSVRLAISYVMLRPFFRQPENGSLDPEEWEFDESPTFPGSYKGQSQQISPKTHPHLELEKTLTLMPNINPGDAVFWHSDVIHAVDPIHEGPAPATVLYIPAVPLTKPNLLYLADQKKKLLNNGETPSDFTLYRTIKYDGKHKGYNGVSDITSTLGKQATGLSKLPGGEPIIQWANEQLGLA